EAPKMVAKGRNLVAEEVKAEARWAGVPIIENPPLARSLYRSVEVGQPIPVDLYAAVAAILAWLYRQRLEAELRERRETAARARAQAASASSSSCWCRCRPPAWTSCWRSRLPPRSSSFSPRCRSDAPSS